MMMFSMNDMVPQNHMLRLIDRAINWNFIYDLVEEKYCPDNGRPSMDLTCLVRETNGMQRLPRSLSWSDACFLSHRDTE